MKKRAFALIIALLSLALLPIGCGDDGDGGGGGGPEPVTGVVVEPAQADVEIGHTLGLTATVTGGDTKELSWYVNGYQNGNNVVGTVSQNSPVTYAAPDNPPEPATVVIKAISVEEPSEMDSCIVTLTFTTVHVDAEAGSDVTGSGSINLPFKTITQALTLADSGMTVLAAPGTYGDLTGEVFPLEVPQGVTLEGENWETCVLSGHEQVLGSYIGVHLESDWSAVRKFTMQDHADPGMDRWNAAVWVGGADHAWVDSMRFFERSYYACIRIDGAPTGATTNTLVENCFMDVRSDVEPPSGFNRGFEIVFDEVDTIVRDCTVYGFHTGLFFNLSSNALIQGCDLEHNSFGAYLCCADSETSNPNPDFGGGARISIGGNVFRNNSACGLSNTAANAIYAKFNIWENDPPVEGVDYCNAGTGSVITE